MNPGPGIHLSAPAFAWVALALSTLLSHACNVPVFRYALERWPAGNYDVVIFHRGLNPVEQTRISGWESTAQSAAANVGFRRVDVNENLSAADAELWKAHSNSPIPGVVIRLPDAPPKEAPLWTGSLTELNVSSLIDSPARRVIADRLSGGDSAVWVLLSSGDNAQDESVATLLTNELRRLEGTLKLPPAAPDDPAPRSTLPLQIKFSVLRVTRSPAEEFFTRMLLHDEEIPAGKPVAVPVFGRGRALAALSGFELSAKTFSQAAAFLCGACSCEVKELNPGKDLLLARDWEKLFVGAPPEQAGSQAGQSVQIAPGNPMPSHSAPAHIPNERRGLKMLASTSLAFGSILLLLVGVVLVRSLRVK